jgi:RND superfamily putative drug exporter
MAESIIKTITNHRVKYLIVLGWLILVAVAGPLAGKLTDAQKNDAKSWLPGSAESTQVLDAQAAFASPDTLPAVVVYERASGLTPADQAKISADAVTFRQIPDLDGEVTGPITATDGQAAQILVPINLGPNGWTKALDLVTSMRQTASSGSNNMTVHVTGPAGFAADSAESFEGIDSTLLFSTIAVVVIILLFTYRSPLLWLLPVISAGVALTCAQAVIYLLAKHAGLVVNAQSQGILTVLVFGAGTDYALLLVARYREELRRHHDRHEAMAIALHRAGPAILASASTVVISMLCLMLAVTNSTRGLGPVAAIGIVIALAIMLTLLPALLVTVGRWIFWPFQPKEGSAEPTTTGLWARVGAAIAKGPRKTWIVTTVALAALAIGIVQLDATGLTNKESFTATPESVTGSEALARHFPAGAGNPVIVISRAGQAGQVRDLVASTPGIDPSSVTQPVVKGDSAYIQGVLTAEADSPAAYDTVDRLRDRVHAVAGAQAKVGGNSAVNLDVQRAARYDRNLIIPIILLVVFLILALLLRAVLSPVLLIGTVVLSFGAAMGASALIFKHLLGFGGADTSFPLFVFVFLVALGIDYNIFLMTRVREETAAHGTRRAALIGLGATGGVITSAGFVLAGTFAVLATLPLVAFAEIGITVALGVLLDTIIVRSVLVTALNLDIGPRIWWPNQLSRASDVAPADAPELVRPATGDQLTPSKLGR